MSFQCKRKRILNEGDIQQYQNTITNQTLQYQNIEYLNIINNKLEVLLQQFTTITKIDNIISNFDNKFNIVININSKIYSYITKEFEKIQNQIKQQNILIENLKKEISDLQVHALHGTLQHNLYNNGNKTNFTSTYLS